MRYDICLKGEWYISVDAPSRDDAVDAAIEQLGQAGGHFKIRDTEISPEWQYEGKA